MARLTDKQKRFITEYLVDSNATQAAIRAGYSSKTAKNIACENLTKPHVQAELQKRQEKIQDKLEITQEKVIQELVAVAFANGADFAEVIALGDLQSVKFKVTEELPVEKRAAISSIKCGSSGMEVKTYDKLRAMELLSRILGYLDANGGDKNKTTALADTIIAAYAKRKENGDE